MYGSLISVFDETHLLISDSSFSSVFCYEEGAVLFAGKQKAKVVIMRSNFTANASVQGGVFYVESDSVIQIFDSQIFNNFGVTSGVIQAKDNGYYEIYNTKIFNNYAVSSSVSQIFDSVGTSIISNSTIYSNKVLNSLEVSSELTSACNYLCFFSENFRQYLIGLPSKYQTSSINMNFQVISAALQILNNTEIFSTDAILDSYLSNVELQNVKIREINSISGNILIFTSTTLTIINTEVESISSLDRSSLISVSLGSIITINGLIFSNSNIALLNIISAQATLEGLAFHNITSKLSSIYIFK